jgi:hypothetical protein
MQHAGYVPKRAVHHLSVLIAALKGAVCKTVALRVELEDAAGQIATQSPEANPRENFLLYLQGAPSARRALRPGREQRGTDASSRGKVKRPR